MEVSSVPKLCHHLISSAIQRCRLSEDLCRLSVLLQCSPPSSSLPPSVRISISDTGAGSCLDEFKDLRCSRESVSAERWDGVVSVTTTGISDNEIYNYQLNIKETTSTRRLTKQPSNPKNGAKFSGTEVSLSTSDSIDDLLAEMTRFLQKMLMLKFPTKLPHQQVQLCEHGWQADLTISCWAELTALSCTVSLKVATELAVKYIGTSGSHCDNVIIANECDPLPSLASNIERLKLGFEDYVIKHGNSLDKRCPSCIQSWEHVKVGSGTACSTESYRSAGHVMEAIIIISESSEPSSPCIRAIGPKTEVLYFKDFSPCLITHSSLHALGSIDWKSYGLSLRSAIDQDGHALLEWDNLPLCAHIDIVLHCYHKQVMVPALRQKAQVERNLVKKAVKNALDDLKVKHAGILLSARALKICSYAPDLARTIAGLILSSNDSDFQGECISLLGLQSQNIEGENVAESIREKIIAVIEMNDRKPQRSSAPFLFEEDCFPEPDFQDEEYEGEESLCSFDL